MSSDDLSVSAELMELEPIFHRLPSGATSADFQNLMAPDFWEIGASGHRYTRDDALRALETRYADSQAQADQWQAKEFRCRQLAPNLYLLTYTLLQDNDRLTRRTTIWQRSPGGWQIVFHQGTIVKELRQHVS